MAGQLTTQCLRLPIAALRGLNNRVIGGVLVYVERENLISAVESVRGYRSDVQRRAASGSPDRSVFKLGTPLYNAITTTDHQGVQLLGLRNADGIYATYNDGTVAAPAGNHYPFAGLFNGRRHPRRVQHVHPGVRSRFPYSSTSTSRRTTQTWIDVMNYGLMIDDVKADKVTAQLVVYNAELGYFGNVMVFSSSPPAARSR